MADKIHEGIEDVPGFELTEEMRGTVVDHRAEAIRKVWLGVGLCGCVFALLAGWLTFHFTKTEEEILAEKLADRAAVAQMITDARVPIQSVHVNIDELKRAISTAIDASTTTLRTTAEIRSPYIKERSAAIMLALEGLMRLELEYPKELKEQPSLREFHERALRSVGEVGLEYFDGGVLDHARLIPSAWQLKLIDDEQTKTDPPNHKELAELRKELHRLLKEEDNSVGAAFYTLGRWYRYYNEITRAKDCFDFSRKYVDGYYRANTFVKGRLPEDLSPAWNTYVGTLESLAELAYKSGHYRQARIYLSRIFSPPEGLEKLISRHRKLKRPRFKEAYRLDRLKSDLVILKQAIKDPLQLPSFPDYIEQELKIDWTRLSSLLVQGESMGSNSVRGALWSALGQDTRDALSVGAQNDELSTELRSKIIATLNKVVRGPALTDLVDADGIQLSQSGKELLAMSRLRVPTPEERVLLNRTLVDHELQEAITNLPILSDGSYLSRTLTNEQASLLNRLYSRALSDPSTTAEIAREIEQKQRELNLGKLDVKDLALEIKRQHAFYQNVLNESSTDLIAEDLKITDLHSRISELETENEIDLDSLLTYKAEEEASRVRHNDLHQTKESASKLLDSLESERELLKKPFQEKLLTVEQKIAGIQRETEALASNKENLDESLLVQLNNQITLRRRYLDLLNQLRDTEGSRELERLAIERQRLSAEIETLKHRIHGLTGDAREIAQFELTELEDAFHNVMTAFDETLSPIQTVLEEIAEQENEIWKAESTLRQAREEILQLVGVNNFPGSIEEKANRRRQLLLMRADDSLSTGLYDAEIRQLNQQLSEDHAKLNLLLQTENQARQLLHTFYPHVEETEWLVRDAGSLASLRDYLNKQSELMHQYEARWRQKELLDDIAEHEDAILKSFSAISASLGESLQLSEKQTRELTRHFENILTARSRKQNSQTLLSRLLKTGDPKDAEPQISGSGYLLDTVHMYQMEHELGLNLSAYRRQFEERQTLIKEIQKALVQKTEIQQQKLAATRRRDQRAIDELIPEVAKQESIVDLLSKRLLKLNTSLRGLASEYESRLDRVKNYRNSLVKQIGSIEGHLDQLSVDIAQADSELTELTGRMIGTIGQITKTISTLSVEDLSGLDEIIESQERELERLTQIQKTKQQEHFFKAKALWLIAQTMVEQSNLSQLDGLTTADFVDYELWEQIQDQYSLVYEEFDRERVYTNEGLGPVERQDKGQALYELWIDYLERTALRAFLEDLPRYAQRLMQPGLDRDALTKKQQQDVDLIMSTSRFLAGKIHMQRSLRYIRTSHALPSENAPAKKELEAATSTFLSFLNFAEPLVWGRRGDEHGISGETHGSQEFPYRQRRTVNQVSEAKIFLGVIASLRNAPHDAIGHYRDLLRAYAAQLPSTPDSVMVEDGMLGQTDPILLDETTESQYHPFVYPFYASILAYHEQAHEVVYRLGLAYKELAEETYRKALENEGLPYLESDKDFEEAKAYAYRSIAYFTQVILTQSYSPYRKAALLKRAQLRKQYGMYQEARDDLVALLGSPNEKGGSWELADITLKGDLPGELDPGYTYVAFELGKLHLENENYVAAQEAFFNAKQSDGHSLYVLQAKIAYAETLMATENWLMADLLLSELVQEKFNPKNPMGHHYNIDLLVQLATVKKHLGSPSATRSVLERMFQHIPRELIVDEDLDLSNPYGRHQLETDFRDAIRPLALGCMEYAEVLRSNREFEKARYYYGSAQTLLQMLPWLEDRVLRDYRREEFLSYRRAMVMKARWEELKTDAIELGFASLADFRQTLELVKRTDTKLETDAIQDHIDAALAQVSTQQDRYHEVLEKLSRFHKQEQQRLPEVRQRQQVLELRERGRELGEPDALRYDALTRVRNTVLNLVDISASDLPAKLKQRFGRDSLEQSLINEFVLEFAQQIPMTEEDRALMLPTRSNLDNLLTLSDPEVRLAGFHDSLMRWVEARMRNTGLDDIFIAVSPQAQVLEEVDLYRASLLSSSDDRFAYQQLAEIVDDYLEQSKQIPTRISSPQTVWQIVQLGAMTAEFQQDWQRLVDYTAYLLDDSRMQFFQAEDKSDLYQARLSQALGWVRLGQRHLGDTVYLHDPKERLEVQLLAEENLGKGKKALAKLRSVPGKGTAAITTRVRAKQILSEEEI